MRFFRFRRPEPVAAEPIPPATVSLLIWETDDDYLIFGAYRDAEKARADIPYHVRPYRLEKDFSVQEVDLRLYSFEEASCRSRVPS